MRIFNTSGPCDPDKHYTVMREALVAKGQRLVEQGRNFTIFAPCQAGKTTYFQHALILVGVSTVAELVLSSAFLFNVVDELRIPYFTLTQVQELIGQHVARQFSDVLSGTTRWRELYRSAIRAWAH